MSASWKTSYIGLATLIIGLVAIWAPAEYQPKIQASVACLAGFGLIKAKDQDK